MKISQGSTGITIFANVPVGGVIRWSGIKENIYMKCREDDGTTEENVINLINGNNGVFDNDQEVIYYPDAELILGNPGSPIYSKKVKKG